MAMFFTSVLTLIFFSTQCILIETQKVDQQSTKNVSSKAIIFPGTKWCGPGNISQGYDDLGIFRKADACCRDHDHCPVYIDAGQTKYGLKNDGWYSKMHCDCDTKFMECLRNNTDFASFKISVLYFNFFQPLCFKEDYPSKCVDFFWFFFPLRCKKYAKDTSAPKEYQYIDNPVIYAL